jgi:predicted  nucleic acid-binding Zn-ribbon protein
MAQKNIDDTSSASFPPTSAETQKKKFHRTSFNHTSLSIQTESIKLNNDVKQLKKDVKELQDKMKNLEDNLDIKLEKKFEEAHKQLNSSLSSTKTELESSILSIKRELESSMTITKHELESSMTIIKQGFESSISLTEKQLENSISSLKTSINQYDSWHKLTLVFITIMSIIGPLIVNFIMQGKLPPEYFIALEALRNNIPKQPIL